MDDAFLLAVSRVKGCSVFQGSLGLSGDEPAGFAKPCNFPPSWRVLGVVLGPQVSILLGTESGSLWPAHVRSGWERIRAFIDVARIDVVWNP